MSEPLTVYLIRHGESEANRAGLVQGHLDPPLSDLGLLQSERVVQRFAATPLTAIYSSSLLRARYLAEGLAKGREVPMVYMHGLMERSQGIWEPMTIADANRLYPEERQRVREDPQAAPPGGESAVEVWDRLHVAWRRILERSHGQVAVVSHSGVLAMLLGAILGLPRRTPFAAYPFHIAHCGVSEVQVRGSRGYAVLSINDVCHLQGLPDGRG